MKLFKTQLESLSGGGSRAGVVVRAHQMNVARFTPYKNQPYKVCRSQSFKAYVLKF